jgi:hypothetical protein
MLKTVNTCDLQKVNHWLCSMFWKASDVVFSTAFYHEAKMEPDVYDFIISPT